MKLSVIILNYKVPYHVLLCLESVRKSLKRLDAEIIVVDNCSEDESFSLVKEHFPEVIFFQNEKNEGFSKGNNRGVKISKGEYICLLNPDTVVPETVFENVLQFAENHPNFGAVGVKMIDGTGNFLPESKRNLPTPKVAFQKLRGSAKKYYANHLKESETGKIEILPGAFMFMKKHRYMEVGGLDDDYFMYGEDIDLSYKFTKAGHQNYYLGEETILHYKGESTLKNADYAKRFYGAMLLFHKKHFRSNFAIDVLVKYGLEIAKLSSRLRSKNKGFSKKHIQKIYVITGEGAPYFNELEKKYGVKPAVYSIEKIAQMHIENSLLVFDTGVVSFQNIFLRIKNLKSRGNCFRIISVSGDFMIGSDSSDHKGDVFFF